MVSVDYGNWTVGCGQNTNNGVGRATGHAPFARKVEGQPEEGEEEVVSVSWSSLFPLMSCREGVCVFGEGEGDKESERERESVGLVRVTGYE